MPAYKSWSGLQAQLSSFLCPQLRGCITYFLTRYHQVHNTYGRASIRLDGKELVTFTWHKGYAQELDINQHYLQTGTYDRENPELTAQWAQNATFSEYDFLEAATTFLSLSIKEALGSPDPIIRILAILDRRIGKRTLEKIRSAETYKTEPQWVSQFYELRLSPPGESKE